MCVTKGPQQKYSLNIESYQAKEQKLKAPKSPGHGSVLRCLLAHRFAFNSAEMLSGQWVCRPCRGLCLQEVVSFYP